MRSDQALGLTLAIVTVACGSPSKKTPNDPASGSGSAEPCYYDCKKSPDGPATGQPANTPPGPAAAGVPRATGPVGELAQRVRDAADNLDKAEAALQAGNKNLADQLFSSAELMVGVDTLASIAPRFRAGGPPRITTPTVKVESAAPQPKTVGSSEAEDVAAKVPPPPVTGSLTGTLMIDGKPLTGTFGLITLEPTKGAWKPRTAKHLTLEQRNREFLPHVMAVSVGSTVTFPNFDPVFHNVFSTSPVAPFDLGLYKSNESREFTFTKEGIVRLGCNLHANMSAYIAVVAAPAYVVTDDTGHFAFRRMSPGTYKLKAWSERSKSPIEQTVSIKAGSNDITVGVAADAPAGPQPDKFGGKRG